MAAKCPGTCGTVEQRQTPGTSKSLGVSIAQYVNLPRVIDSADESWKKTYQLPKTQTFWQY